MISKSLGRLTALAAIALAGLAAGPVVASAQERAATAAPGRYTMMPVDGGFARLDTETGVMSMCRSRGAEWSCEPMPDVGPARGTTARLEAENKELRSEIKRLEDMIGLGERKDEAEGKRAERPGGLTLPSEEDVDKALSYVERMVKKFQEKMKQFERGHGDLGKGTPL